MNPELPLDAMARDMVGDGKSPNLYFVTKYNGTTIAVCTHFDEAARIASVNAEVVEDRLQGIVWSRRYGDERFLPHRRSLP